jgi:hypothetical protein
MLYAFLLSQHTIPAQQNNASRKTKKFDWKGVKNTRRAGQNSPRVIGGRLKSEAKNGH